MKRFVSFFVFQFIIASLLFAQNDVDALRYSMTTFGGTARYMSMAGAFGSLGADFSTLSTNPAGIGLFTKSEFSVTPALFTGKTKSNYFGAKTDDIQYNFNLSNVGIIIASEIKDNSIFRNFQFGIGLNRLNNFNNRMLVEGYSTKNSITDTWVDYADGIYYDNIESDKNNQYTYDLNPAWYTYLIDTIPGSTDQYYSPVDLSQGGGIWQRQDLNAWGSMNEFVLSGGTNVHDRIYLGLTLGFPFIRYFEDATYSEEDKNNKVAGDFRNLTRYSELTTTGSGFNIKFGIIVRATNWLRLGGAFHSPTWFNNMTDSWYYNYSSEFDNGDYYSQGTPIGYYDYRLETPMRALGSISFIIKQTALISADYEYTDFSQSRLRAPDYDFFNENQNIRSKYTQTHNFRVGGEYVYNGFAVRGGVAYYMSPFANNINNSERFYFTGGLGFRDKNVFVDLAYVRSFSDSDYYLYSSPNVVSDPVKNRIITNNILLTLGFRY